MDDLDLASDLTLTIRGEAREQALLSEVNLMIPDNLTMLAAPSRGISPTMRGVLLGDGRLPLVI